MRPKSWVASASLGVAILGVQVHSMWPQQKYFSHPNSVIYLFSNPIHETKTETANRCLAGGLYCKMVHFRVLSESTPVQGSFLIIPQKWGIF